VHACRSLRSTICLPKRPAPFTLAIDLREDTHCCIFDCCRYCCSSRLHGRVHEVDVAISPHQLEYLHHNEQHRIRAQDNMKLSSDIVRPVSVHIVCRRTHTSARGTGHRQFLLVARHSELCAGNTLRQTDRYGKRRQLLQALHPAVASLNAELRCRPQCCDDMLCITVKENEGTCCDSDSG
jgi:hypothetical protein